MITVPGALERVREGSPVIVDGTNEEYYEKGYPVVVQARDGMRIFVLSREDI